MGRPPHMPGPAERRLVESMAGYGVPVDDIARVLGIDSKTLKKHYRAELDTGHILANAKVAESLFRKATGDGPKSVTAAIFWLKTRAGWREARPEDDGSANVLNIKRRTVYEAPPVEVTWLEAPGQSVAPQRQK